MPMNTLLENQPLFQHLDEQALNTVLQHAHVRTLAKGTFLFYQDDPATAFYIVERGRIRLSQLSPEGQQVIVRFLTEGEAFGIVAVLSNIPYPVAADAVEDSTLIGWDGETFQHLMLQYPQLALNGMRIMAQYMQEMISRLREITTERVEQRIARALLRLARQMGKPTPNGILIDMALTRKDVAEMSGTTLYTVSRSLSKWQEMGIIQSSREQICICVPHKLAQIAEEWQA